MYNRSMNNYVFHSPAFNRIPDSFFKSSQKHLIWGSVALREICFSFCGEMPGHKLFSQNFSVKNFINDPDFWFLIISPRVSEITPELCNVTCLLFDYSQEHHIHGNKQLARNRLNDVISSDKTIDANAQKLIPDTLVGILSGDSLDGAAFNPRNVLDRKQAFDTIHGPEENKRYVFDSIGHGKFGGFRKRVFDSIDHESQFGKFGSTNHIDSEESY